MRWDEHSQPDNRPDFDIMKFFIVSYISSNFKCSVHVRVQNGTDNRDYVFFRIRARFSKKKSKDVFFSLFFYFMFGVSVLTYWELLFL